MGVREFNGISLQFNAAIMSLANKCIPLGWYPHEQADELTIEALRDVVNRNRGAIYVDPNPIQNSPFDDLEHDYAWMALVTWVVLNRLGHYPSTFNDFLYISQTINVMLLMRYGVGPEVNKMQRYVDALVVGMYWYSDRWSHPPVKVKDFVEAYASYGMTAVDTEW